MVFRKLFGIVSQYRETTTKKHCHNHILMEKEITRTLKLMHHYQANEICTLQKKLEESRLQMMRSYNNTLFNLYAEIKRTEANLPQLSRNKQKFTSRLTELKTNTIRMRKTINDDIVDLSEEAISLEANISEEFKIIKQI